MLFFRFLYDKGFQTYSFHQVGYEAVSSFAVLGGHIWSYENFMYVARVLFITQFETVTKNSRFIVTR